MSSARGCMAWRRSHRCIAGSRRHDGDRLRGIVGIQYHPEPVLAVRGIARSLGSDHRLDIGGLKDVLETQSHTGRDGTDSGTAPPRVEPPGSRLFAGWFVRTPVRFDLPMIAASPVRHFQPFGCNGGGRGESRIVSGPGGQHSPNAKESKSRTDKRAIRSPIRSVGRLPHAVRLAGSEKRPLVPHPPASANQATMVEPDGASVRYLSSRSSVDPSALFWSEIIGSVPVLRSRRCRRDGASQKCPDAPRSDGGGKGVESGAPGRLKPTRSAPN